MLLLYIERGRFSRLWWVVGMGIRDRGMGLLYCGERVVGVREVLVGGI